MLQRNINAWDARGRNQSCRPNPLHTYLSERTYERLWRRVGDEPGNESQQPQLLRASSMWMQTLVNSE